MALVIAASGQRTTRRGLRAEVPKALSEAFDRLFDTVAVAKDDSLLRLTGYEKPLRANRETLLVTNTDSVRTLVAVELAIDYRSAGHRQLHSRTVWVPVRVKPGGTTMAVFPSWDVNRVFYYHVNKPTTRTSGHATPYAVHIEVRKAAFERISD